MSDCSGLQDTTIRLTLPYGRVSLAEADQYEDEHEEKACNPHICHGIKVVVNCPAGVLKCVGCREPAEIAIPGEQHGSCYHKQNELHKAGEESEIDRE